MFHPLTEAISAELVATARGTIHLESGESGLKAEVAFQLSDDGVTWSDGGSLTTS